MSPTMAHQQTQEFMQLLLQVTEGHTEKLIRKLAEKYNFDADEEIALHKFNSALTAVDGEPVATVLTKKGKTVKKSKKTAKDPNAPKKAKNAYMFFSSEKNAEVKTKFSKEQDDGTLKAPKGSEVAKEIGKMWKELSEAEKLPYQEMYTKAKAKYEEEMKVYELSKEE